MDTNEKLKGFAYVLFTFPENALTALAEMDGTFCLGRVMHILPSKAAPASAASIVIDENSTYLYLFFTFFKCSNFKKLKEDKMKKDSMNKVDNWNSFFISSNAVYYLFNHFN